MTCQNPKDFYGHNLLTTLKQQLIESAKYFSQNRFALSWVAIALCNNNEMIDTVSYGVLTATPGQYKFHVGVYIESFFFLYIYLCI